MLDKTTYTPAAPEPSTIAGRTIAHSYTWSETKRVRLAAKATFGAVVVTPLTAIQASQVFDVPVTAVAGELKRLGVVLRSPQRQRPRSRRADVGVTHVRAKVRVPGE